MSVRLFGVHLYSDALSGTQKPKGGCLRSKQKQPKWGSGKLRENAELCVVVSRFFSHEIETGVPTSVGVSPHWIKGLLVCVHQLRLFHRGTIVS